MKNGTKYAGVLKKAYTKFRQTVSDPLIPEADEPTDRLAIAILGVECGDVAAERAVGRLLGTMVDWNDVRVSKPNEIAQVIGTQVPNAAARCKCLADALQAVFDRENDLSLNRLTSMGRREAKQYMETLEGVDDYGVASVSLWSLGAHAIPVSDRLLAALREARLVHPNASRGEVQAFLERHISAADAKEFCLVMQSFHKKNAADATGAKSTDKTKATGGRKKPAAANKKKKAS